MVTQNQKSLIIFWVIVVIIAESIMFVLNKHLAILYLAVACLFLAGFILRVLNIYPGKKEPLILDFSAMVIALLFAYVSQIFELSNGRFILIAISSLIIFPHLVYIRSNKDI
ncbi:MAG: hypothetical protein JSW40_08675 [Candidatus Omnitrophota bacterium]|nr:MAG: hypothetical protein JSW40_08675 [Candidatus Omnitrophota bacterium]